MVTGRAPRDFWNFDRAPGVSSGEERRMKMMTECYGKSRGKRLGIGLMLAILGCVGFSIGLATVPAAAQDKGGKSAGVYIDAEAGAKDVGLPIYPGARLHKDKDEDTASTKMGLWGGSVEFKLAIVKLESNDPADKVAAFYKKALAKYGSVLDCTNVAGPSDDDKNKDDGSGKLQCDSDKPEAGTMVFKSGSKEKVHIASIKSNGTGSLIDLVYVQVPRSGDK
jgi:hypothetical protein